jgi:DNA-binding response OmpR family regulator
MHTVDSPKILVVDDDKDILVVLDLLLTHNKYEVETIYRWQSINDTINNFSPDLIILDIALGGADGRAICNEIKTKPATKDIPVILFSANTNVEKSFNQYHANDFIAKPFEIDVLMNKIAKHLPNEATA